MSGEVIRLLVQFGDQLKIIAFFDKNVKNYET